MKRLIPRNIFTLGLIALGWLCNGAITPTSSGFVVATAEAVVGRPATPVSYAGVARRTTVRVATPGAGAPGVGVLPGAGAGQAGAGYSGGVGTNLGGPVNRVGVR